MQRVAINTGVFLALHSSKKRSELPKYWTKVTESDKMAQKTYVYLSNTSPPVQREKESYVQNYAPIPAETGVGESMDNMLTVLNERQAARERETEKEVNVK